ncbi:MAG: NifB/NifX family molybdenum-iron cluster-binding protein [Candidatus Thorarchaeota archaeon]
MNQIVGIPAEGSELSDNISAHFGHCPFFMGIEILNNHNYRKIFILANEGHTVCMEPVINMKERKVSDMILTGIGMRPFMGFRQVRINLHQGVNGSIEENVKLFINGQLKPLNESSCGNYSGNARTH